MRQVRAVLGAVYGAEVSGEGWLAGLIAADSTGGRISGAALAALDRRRGIFEHRPYGEVGVGAGHGGTGGVAWSAPDRARPTSVEGR